MPTLLLSALAICPMPAFAQPADNSFLADETDLHDSPAIDGGTENEQADDDEQGRDGGSRQRPRASKATGDTRGAAPAEAAARAAAVNAARSNRDAGLRNFAGEMAGSPDADLRRLEGKGDEALKARGRSISPAGQALDQGKAPIAAGRIGPDDGKAFGAAAKSDEAAKLARMRAAREAADGRDAARIARGARTTRGVGGTAAGAAVGALAVLPTVIEVTTGAEIGLERYVFDSGKAIVTGDAEAMATANRELGRRAVQVGESIAATAQDPARIVRNVEEAGKDLAQTGADAGAAVSQAVSNPAKIGRDAAKAACSVGRFFTGGKC
ncbi:MAG TPA: hypothetical protein VMN38_05760 [Sphingomicrobium sp.]|nr:hypothetical protein [Sphingomicrobium sp.]